MNFIKFKKLYFAISLLLVIPSIIALLIWGLKPNIDFTGGSLLEVEITADTEVTNQAVRQAVKNVYEPESIQKAAESNVLLRGKELSSEQKQQILDSLNKSFAEVKEVKFESVGPILGQELVFKTATAIILVALVIIIYVWRQFSELKYGVCAILAMFHDTLILLGSFSILGRFLSVEVDVLFVTALLTTLSFSIHDTIVIYDRIRELKKKKSKLNMAQIANLAIVETLARSINNSITIIVVLAALVWLGGATIQWFAVALLIGAIAGTYSSTFTAVPLLVLWDEVRRKN